MSEEKETQYFCMCANCGKIVFYEEAKIDQYNNAYCSNCIKRGE